MRVVKRDTGTKAIELKNRPLTMCNQEKPCKIPSSYTIAQETLEEVGNVLKEDVSDTVAFLKVFSDPIRVRILKALRIADLCVCVLVELMDCEYSKLSYHLGVLKKAGLITCTKDGNFLIYHLTEFGEKTVTSFGIP